jgi:hypothetical protein
VVPEEEKKHNPSFYSTLTLTIGLQIWTSEKFLQLMLMAGCLKLLKQF